MKVGYTPEKNNTNKYCELMVDAIKDNNIELIRIKESDIFKQKCDVVILNWYETIKDKDGFLKMFLSYIWKKVKIIYCKMNKIKIVWTVHNRVPHNGKYEKYSLKIMKLLAKKADIKVIHCNETRNLIKELNPNVKDSEIKYIPHPNYINAYSRGSIDYKNKFHIKDDEMVFLFIGQVRPYKNVEKIIEVSKKVRDKKIKFIIAGKPNNKEYEDKIRNLAKESNISLILEFIKDEDMISLIQLSDILILPYDLKSSLNSGTVILAFSEGKNVICPNIGTIKDMNDKSLVYSYDYNTEEEHLHMLELMVEKSYKDFTTNKDNFKNKGYLLREIMKKENNLQIISKKYKEIFETLNLK